MKTLITTQVFPPEVHPSGVMMKELACDLSGHGWEAVVATGFPNHPQGQIFEGFERELYHKEDVDGFTLIRSWHLITSSANIIDRGFMMLSYGLSFIISALIAKKANIIIGGAPPLIGPIVSGIIAKLYKAKLLYILFDIYPDILIDLHLLKNQKIIRVMKLFERLTYRLSDHIIVLSEGFRRTLVVKKHVPSEKISVIPVWLDDRDIVPLDRDNPWRRQMGIEPEKFVALYAGTIGLVSGAEVLVEAARRLQPHQDILFLLVGEGQAKDRVEALARKSGLNNIRFLQFQPREQLSEVQATADVSLVTLSPGQGKTSVPSKVLGYMAASRPVIAAVDKDCDTANLIHTSGCGLVVLPGQGDELAEAILHFYENSKERLTRGEAGHRHFLKHFERQAVLKRYIETIQNVLKSS